MLLLQTHFNKKLEYHLCFTMFSHQLCCGMIKQIILNVLIWLEFIQHINVNYILNTTTIIKTKHSWISVKISNKNIYILILLIKL